MGTTYVHRLVLDEWQYRAREWRAGVPVTPPVSAAGGHSGFIGFAGGNGGTGDNFWGSPAPFWQSTPFRTERILEEQQRWQRREQQHQRIEQAPPRRSRSLMPWRSSGVLQPAPWPVKNGNGGGIQAVPVRHQPQAPPSQPQYPQVQEREVHSAHRRSVSTLREEVPIGRRFAASALHSPHVRALPANGTAAVQPLVAYPQQPQQLHVVDREAVEELEQEIYNGDHGFRIRINAPGFRVTDFNIYTDQNGVLGVEAQHEQMTRELVSVRRWITRRYLLADHVDVRSVRAYLNDDGHLEILGDKKAPTTDGLEMTLAPAPLMHEEPLQAPHAPEPELERDVDVQAERAQEEMEVHQPEYRMFGHNGGTGNGNGGHGPLVRF